jgi:hypothetical protein
VDYCGLLEVEAWQIPVHKDSHAFKEIVMAKIIEFYVPTNFRTPLKGAPLRCGKVIEFYTQITKFA